MPESRETPVGLITPGRGTRKRLAPGDRIGNLTILRDSGERKYHSVVWHCRCELCGNEADFISRDFSQRNITDCGCETKICRRKEKIRPGDMFGLLTVISDSGRRKGSEVLWSCLCQCGKEVFVSTVALHAGKVTDCGCVSSRKTDLLGRQFGKLTVIADEGTKTGDHVWRCRCSCGKECLATFSHLTHGLVKSCGCIRLSVWEDNFKLVEGTSVTKLEACRNGEKLNTLNTSGYTGVYPQNSHGRRTGRWAAQIGFKGKKYYLGAFDRPEDAAEARKLAEERLYDGFIEWYYSEYLPARQEERTGRDIERVQSEKRPPQAAASPV